MRKILYISPEHISGTLPLFCKGHKDKGNYARYVTMFPTRFAFEEDMMMNLPLHPDKSWLVTARTFFNRLRGIKPNHEPEGNPPFWNPGGIIGKMFFNSRDKLIEKNVYDFMDKHDLWNYDIYHYEQGMDFFRDSRAAKKLKSLGKHIVCTYHGTDVRNRGVIKEMHQLSELNLSSELDLLYKYPGLKYLFLPIDTSEIIPVPHENEKIKIAHAARSRLNKGSDYIIEVVRKLEEKYPVELVLMENVPHDEVMRIKSTCDIYIDQLADKGGWGYGMSSVESLAQGLAACTYLNKKYLEFIPEHGFINVNYETLENELIKLIKDKDYRLKAAAKGREWVVKVHDIKTVMDTLYNYYEEAGIIV
jgi:glycosyltransferase involved in cell wall biosynthesis